VKTLHLGEISVATVLESARVPMPISLVLPAATSEALAAARGWLEPRFADLASGNLFLAFHSYLVRTPRHTILIDACVGNDKERPRVAAFHRLKTDWLANLRESGVEPEGVDFVMCTHMHADHIGWNTRLEDGRWVPTFPNARYVFARTEYENTRAVQNRGPGDFRATAYLDSILPVVESGQAMIVESDHALDDHLRLEAAPGHTPGNVVIHLRSGAERAVFSGDVLHHPIQVVHPEWSAGFCEDPVQSALTRRRFVEAHADRQTLVLPAHFPDPTAGRIVTAGDRCGFRFLDE
jgi:glyoxylase-like metal-dependent hydrolase (beta-lactamase superfamily II)